MRSRTITGPPPGTRVEDVPAVPGLGGLYVRGAAGSLAARLRLPGRARPGALPAVAYRVRDVRIDADHLTAYQHLVGEPALDAVPSGYLHVLAFPVATAVMVRDDFPLPLLGMVHVANAASLLRPVRVGDELEITAWTQDLRPHRRGRQLDVVAEVRVAGEVAWRGVSTYLAKAPTSAPPPPAPGAQSAASRGAPAAPAAPGTPSAEFGGSSRVRGSQAPNWRADPELDGSGPTPGRDGGGRGRGHDSGGPGPDARVADGDGGEHDGEASARWRLDAGVGRRYGAVSGDRNPIHMSALSAKAFGFPRTIAHGMYTAARALAAVGPGRGETYDWSVEFAKPVLLPGTVSVQVTHPEPGCAAYVGTHPRTGAPHFSGTVTRT